MSAGVSDAELLGFRVRLTDGAAIACLEAAAVERYLAGHGYAFEAALTEQHLTRQPGGAPLGHYWRRQDPAHGELLVLVPMAEAGDRVSRLAEIVHQLASLERRSELLVYRDLASA